MLINVLDGGGGARCEVINNERTSKHRPTDRPSHEQRLLTYTARATHVHKHSRY